MGPWLASQAPHAQLDPVALAWQPPSLAHWLGTDSYSRDVWSRLLFGARATVGIALLAVTIALSVGTLVGALAALAPRPLDALLMRATDALLATPRLLLLLLVVAGAGTLDTTRLAILIGATGWMPTARLVRQESGRLLATPYLEGARALGVPWPRLLAHHLLPSLFPPPSPWRRRPPSPPRSPSNRGCRISASGSPRPRPVGATSSPRPNPDRSGIGG